jgi:hypothetical protein
MSPTTNIIFIIVNVVIIIGTMILVVKKMYGTITK